MSTMFKMFVGNISFNTTEDEIRKIFDPHIEIEDVIIARDDEGKSRGYGFVLTRDHAAGRAAIRKVGKFEIDGRRIYCKEADGKRRKGKSQQQRRGGRPRAQSRPRRSFRPRRAPRRQDAPPADRAKTVPTNSNSGSDANGYVGLNDD